MPNPKANDRNFRPSVLITSTYTFWAMANSGVPQFTANLVSDEITFITQLALNQVNTTNPALKSNPYFLAMTTSILAKMSQKQNSIYLAEKLT